MLPTSISLKFSLPFLQPHFSFLTPLLHSSQLMKDLSFFLLKNTVGAKMKKGFRSFCNGDGSTSTLNQRKTNQDMPCLVTPSFDSSSYFDDTNLADKTPTLEEMILQLELEEAAARKTKLDEYGETRRRMSCVNNSDVLRSAKNALNQYPRFSLDGRDAMYRSSFRNMDRVMGRYEGGRKSICCSSGLRGRLHRDLDFERNLTLPPTLAGESVVWCKPGVVAKLMGLDVMPVPITRRHSKGKFGSPIRKQNLKRAERHEIDKRRVGMGMNGSKGIERENGGSCSNTRYCVMKPISVERGYHRGENLLADRRRYVYGQHI